jgi:hypothetical protein
MWVLDAEFVEVVDVGETKDDGGEKDDCAVGGLGEEEERDGTGAEENFFGYGAL